MTHSDKLSGVIFVMIGPGGAGKNAIMRAILKDSNIVSQLATATTRPMRDDEKQNREHLFVSLDEFRRMIANNELLEHQEVTLNRFYGIPRKSVSERLSQGNVLIADIEVLGAKQLAKAFPDNTVQIFVTVPGETIEDQLQILKERMEQREDNTKIEERLNRAQNLEFPYQYQCDYVVVNDELNHAIQLVKNIIEQELQKRHLLGELS